MMDLIAQDKKVKRGQLTFILVRGIGDAFVARDVDASEVRDLPRRETRRAMTLDDWLAIAVIVVCLLLSFFFSGSETALTASSRATMLRLAEDGNRNAAIVARLLSMRERLIGALLLSNNVVNILASSLATSLFLLWFGDVGVLYATVVMTVLVVVFAEILPKTAAINAPERISLLVARPISWVVRLFGPVLMAIEALVRGILRVGRHPDRRKPADPVGARGTARRGRSACTARAASRSSTAT